MWKHILNVYPDGMSGKERMDYMKKKAYEYQALRDCWKEMVQNGQVSVIISYSCLFPTPVHVAVNDLVYRAFHDFRA